MVRTGDSDVSWNLYDSMRANAHTFDQNGPFFVSVVYDGVCKIEWGQRPILLTRKVYLLIERCTGANSQLFLKPLFRNIRDTRDAREVFALMTNPVAILHFA